MDEILKDLDIAIDYEFYKAYELFYKEKIEFNDPLYKVYINSMVHLLNKFGMYDTKYLVNNLKEGIPCNNRLNRLCYHMKSKFKYLTDDTIKFLTTVDTQYPTLDEDLVSKLGDMLEDFTKENNLDKYNFMIDLSKSLSSSLVSNDKNIIYFKDNLIDEGNIEKAKSRIKDYKRKITIEDVINSPKFKNQCEKYGFNYDAFKLVDNYILVKTLYLDLFAIMNDKYDLVGINRFNISIDLDLQMRKYIDEMRDFKLDSPFDCLGFEDIIFLANENIKVEDKIDIQILSYIRFLNEEINIYYNNTLPLQFASFNVPSVFQYLSNVNENMDTCIKLRTNAGLKTNKDNILELLGQKRETQIDYMDIENIADFINSNISKEEVKKRVNRFTKYKAHEKTII